MGVGAGLYMYDVVVKSSRSLSHLLMRFCYLLLISRICNHIVINNEIAIQEGDISLICS